MLRSGYHAVRSLPKVMRAFLAAALATALDCMSMSRGLSCAAIR